MHLCIYLRQKKRGGGGGHDSSEYGITLFLVYAVISCHVFSNSPLDFFCPVQESHSYIQQAQVWIPHNYF